MMKYEMPRCFDTSVRVRAMRMPNLATSASDVQIFWPFTTVDVAVALGARAQVREVGARAGLAEQLAPHLLAARASAAGSAPSARRSRARRGSGRSARCRSGSSASTTPARRISSSMMSWSSGSASRPYGWGQCGTTKPASTSSRGVGVRVLRRTSAAPRCAGDRPRPEGRHPCFGSTSRPRRHVADRRYGFRADDPHREVLRGAAVGVAERAARAVDLVLAREAAHLQRGFGEAQHARRADRVRREHAARAVDRHVALHRGRAALGHLPAFARARRSRGSPSTSARTS